MQGGKVITALDGAVSDRLVRLFGKGIAYPDDAIDIAMAAECLLRLENGTSDGAKSLMVLIDELNAVPLDIGISLNTIQKVSVYVASKRIKSGD